MATDGNNVTSGVTQCTDPNVDATDGYGMTSCFADAAENTTVDGKETADVTETTGIIKISDDDLAARYKMDNRQRGRFIIINNMEFDYGTGLKLREGSDVDEEKLKKLFGGKLGFEVDVKRDLTAVEMQALMNTEGQKDHKDCDCFGAVVLSHGADDGELYGRDGNTTTIDDLVDPIKKCQSLAGKPKFFFFQACRGYKLEEGLYYNKSVYEDDGFKLFQSDDGLTAERQDEKRQVVQVQVRIPVEADVLYAFSTVAGYFAWTNKKEGSWFIQTLCEKLGELAFKDMDLGRILTRVNCKVATEFESVNKEPFLTGKIQASSIVSMLTKDLFFTPPRNQSA